MLIPFFDNEKDNTTIEEIEQSFKVYEEVTEKNHITLTISEEIASSENDNNTSSHYNSTTQNICNSLMRLHCYHSILSRLQQQISDDQSIDTLINSISVPQSILSSSKQEMPVVIAEKMYEGYAQKLLMNSILLMLYEVGVDVVDREVVHNLVELAKQSIQNIGIFLSSTNVSLQTTSDYYLSHYAFEPNRIPSSISSINSIREKDYSVLATIRKTAGEKQISNTLLRLIQFLEQKRIYPHSLLQFVYKRIHCYEQLLQMESRVASLYDDIVNNPKSLNVEEIINLQTLRDSLLIEKPQQSELSDNERIINLLSEFYKL